MQSRLKALLFFLKILKGILPFAAFACLVTWTLQFTDAIMYKRLNKLIGLIPDTINKYIPITSDINGVDVTMGYIYFAIALLVVFVIVAKIQKILLKFLPPEPTMQNMDFSMINIPKTSTPIATKKEKVMLNTVLSGLIELNFIPDKTTINTPLMIDLNQLKYQCSEMIALKLEEKYPDAKFTKTDTIFFSTENYKQMNEILDDIKKLYDIVLKINQKNLIHSEINVSFHFANKFQNVKTIYNILNKINALNNSNAFVLTENSSILYSTLKKQSFSFAPIGNWELEHAGQANETISMELFKADFYTTNW